MIENLYYSVIRFLCNINIKLTPYFRRLVRFLALPYAYFYMVNWSECKAGRIRVAYDFLYIFFVLRYFPDNYSLCRFWEKDRSSWKYYYGSIYDPFNRARLRKEVQRSEYKILFDDKEVCYQLCHAANLPIPRQFAFVDVTDNIGSVLKVLHQRTGYDEFFIKPVIGKGGKDIFLVTFNGSRTEVMKNNKQERKTVSVSLDEVKITRRCVVQERIKQHKSLNRISQNSLNTMRIATLLTRKSRVILLGSFLRFGRGNSIVDNSSSGGIGVGIDQQNGILEEIGYDFNSKAYTVHPTSGVSFGGAVIPFWKEVCDMAVKTQMAFPYYKLLGIDLALSEKGPLIIEINASFDSVGLEQKCGPILARHENLEAFREYNLLSRGIWKGD